MSETLRMPSLQELWKQAREALQAGWHKLAELAELDFDDFEPEPVREREVYDELLSRP